MTSDPLPPLLNAAADLGPEYGQRLASHLPMALVALRDLGADGVRLQAFFDRYRVEHGLVTAAAWPGDEPWAGSIAEPACLGQLPGWTAWRRHIRHALRAEGRDAVLRRLLPRLMPGVAGAAFHGLIRTAHAVHADHAEELAAALAYWAARWLPLPGHPSIDAAPVAPAPAGSVADNWIRTLEAAPVLQGLDGRMIVDRVAQVAVHPAFAPWAAGLPSAEDWPARWARAAAQRFVSSGSFTVLHLVTATHAFRALQLWLDTGRDAAEAHFGRAYAAAWLSARTDPGAPARPDPGLDWPEIRARARASDDDHVIKLVWSACAEADAHGGDVWRHAAALAVVHGS